MDNMPGGIDQNVQSVADTYYSHPEKLAQKYQQDQQLIDLLALQKLKSDKEAAAREIQLQMQGQPSTVLAQREQELLGITKDELARQTAGTLQQKQQTAQQNINRIAQQNPHSQTQGIAGLAGAGMKRMASGGIVSFSEGTEVELSEEDKAKVRRLRAIYPEFYAQMSDSAVLSQAPVLIPPLKPSGSAEQRANFERMRAAREKMGLPALAPALLKEWDAQRGARPVPQVSPTVSAKVGATPTPDRISLRGPSPSAETAPPVPPKPAGIAGVPQAQTPDFSTLDGITAALTTAARQRPDFGVEVEPRSPEAQARFDGIMSAEPADAAASRAEASKVFDQTSGRAGIADAYKKMQAERQKLDAELNDPAKLKRERLIATLIGGANKGSFGEVGAGMGAAGLQAGAAQDAARRKALSDMESLQSTGLNLEANLGSASAGAGAGAYETTTRANADGERNAAILLQSDETFRTAVAKLRQDAKKSETEWKQGLLETAADVKDIESRLASMDWEKKGALLFKIMGLESEIRAAAVERYADPTFGSIAQMESALRGDKLDDDERAEMISKLEREKEKARIAGDEAVALAGFKALKAKLEAAVGTASPTDIDPSVLGL